jgi:Tol biopolymer transport system component
LVLISLQAARFSAGQVSAARVTPEQDWLRQAEVRYSPVSSTAVSPEADAAGGVDGVINGAWGFHTENEQSPWWQVDLGSAQAIERVVLFNRCDPGMAERNAFIEILISEDGFTFTKAYAHTGGVFYGKSDGKPLSVSLGGKAARFIRLLLPGKSYFHLDEVEVYDRVAGANIALGKAATQSSTSQWSVDHLPARDAGFGEALEKVLEHGIRLGRFLDQKGVDARESLERLMHIQSEWEAGGRESSRQLYARACGEVRSMALSNPILDFDKILFVKRAPGTLPHMSDQYYGWWSRGGGGLYILEHFREEQPEVRCLTDDWPLGSFLRPDLSYDGTRVLFSYCRFYPEVSSMPKVDKGKLPEDAFYNIYEMDLRTLATRRLTRGRYDDFDARYLPNGDIVFLSTRKGQFVQCSVSGLEQTLNATLPDSYVRCGGDNIRPCAVYTLHSMDSEGGSLRPLSAFENFEWYPSVMPDGTLLFARWDYIDRFNGHFMSLWSCNPDGGNPQLVYGNYTTKPQAVFEARAVPDSDKLIFTAAAHHSVIGGSLVLFDRSLGMEGEAPLIRLTPEVPFPETEAWADSYYANPYPLSEDFYLVSWSDQKLPPHRGSAQVTGEENPVNASGIYLYDRFGNLDLLYRDDALSSMNPIPIQPRRRPPIVASTVDWAGVQYGEFMLQDVYQGLDGVERGSIREIRVIAVPPKPQPYMNQPVLGVSAEDPGKFVLGTAPVETDGSAFFKAPSGVSLFFQALNAEGLAVQTMRSLTYLQPGRTLGCIGCHENRDDVPRTGLKPLAFSRASSPLTREAEGSWPLRYDRLVQPVLDRYCVECHDGSQSGSENPVADLRGEKSYEVLLNYADGDLRARAFERDRSEAGQVVALGSRLWQLLSSNDESHSLKSMADEDIRRLALWMDSYAHLRGAFSAEQESQLEELKRRWSPITQVKRMK